MKLTILKRMGPNMWLMWTFIVFLIGAILLWVATVQDGQRLLNKDDASRNVKVPYH